jgi:hypothetical protein
MRKNLPDQIVGDAKACRGSDLQVRERATPHSDPALPESLQVRAERDSLLWILRIVRREVNWTDDSPTLRMINAALARS